MGISIPEQSQEDDVLKKNDDVLKKLSMKQLNVNKLMLREM